MLGRFKNALKETFAELKSQNGPKTNFSGIVQASRAAQLAALNESPFERKMLERMGKVIDALGAAVNALEKPVIGP